jgi:hypothetical protein
VPPVRSVPAASVKHPSFGLREERVAPKLAWPILLATLAVAATRAPYILFHGRFWAEEGSLHFQHMVENSSPSDLFYVQTRTGYYNAFANGATWLASLVPLLYAPLVTAWLSFGVLATVVGVALFWPSELLPNAGAKIAAAVLLAVGTLAEPEAWLNSINAQTYLGILTLLLLFTPVERISRRRFGVSLAFLAVACLSGLYSIALAPLFLIRALTERGPRRWMQAITISAIAVVQIIVFLLARSGGTLADTKVSIPGPSELVRTVGGWHLGAFVLGPTTIDALMRGLEDHSWLAALALGLTAIAVAGVLAFLLWTAPNARVPLLLLGAFVLIELLVQLGSLEQATGRYAVLPIAILTLMAIHGVATSVHPWVTKVGIGLGAVVLVAGLSGFWTRQPTLLRCQGCPQWSEEVREWQAGYTTTLAIWPYDRGSWTIELQHEPSQSEQDQDNPPD